MLTLSFKEQTDKVLPPNCWLPKLDLPPDTDTYRCQQSGGKGDLGRDTPGVTSESSTEVCTAADEAQADISAIFAKHKQQTYGLRYQRLVHTLCVALQCTQARYCGSMLLCAAQGALA